MNKRGNVSAIVLGFLFVVFALYFVYGYHSSITGFITSFNNPDKFYVNQEINGTVNIDLGTGEQIDNETVFQLILFSGETQYSPKRLTAEEIFNKTFLLERKTDGTKYFFDTVGIYKLELLNFSVRYSTKGDYTLKFMKRDTPSSGLSPIIEKPISLIDAPAAPAVIKGLLNLTFVGLEFNDDGDITRQFTGNFKKGDFLACLVEFKGNVELPVDILIYKPGTTDLKEPYASFKDVNKSTNEGVICEGQAGNKVSCVVGKEIDIFKQGFWSCLATQGSDTLLSNSMTMSGSTLTFIKNISDFAITKDGVFVGSTPINLNNYFLSDSGKIEYTVIGAKYIAVTPQQDGTLNFGNSLEFEGNETVMVRAFDGSNGIFSNKFNIKVGTGQKVPANQCYPNWDCEIWSECTNGRRTRTCIDKNSCNNELGKPFLTQACQEEQNVGNAFRQEQEPPEVKVKQEGFKIKGGWRIFLIILIVVSVFGTGGFALYWFKFRKPKSVITGEQQTTNGQANVGQQVAGGQVTAGQQTTQAPNLDEMKKYAEEMLNQGQTDQKIKQDLIAAGWNKTDVDNAVNYLVLKRFVNSKIKSGFPKDKIKESLLAKGWKLETIDKIFIELKI